LTDGKDQSAGLGGMAPRTFFGAHQLMIAPKIHRDADIGTERSGGGIYGAARKWLS